jgi:transglutaminase-like putative cysteine protease
MDLTPFIARGFPGDLDRAIAEVGVAGIDREQSQSAVRLCPETEAFLYDGYSPTRIRYRRGARPVLEEIAAPLAGATPRQSALALMRWVCEQVQHPHICGPTAPNRAYSEEQLITSGRGWCNEQARVFVALCEVLEIPARLCFLFHSNLRSGHTTAEVYLDNRWAFFDPTFDLTVELPDGRLAEARELSGEFREMAHHAYRQPLQEYYARSQPFVANEPGWNPRDRPTVERGGDLLAFIGICNYLTEGVEAV